MPVSRLWRRVTPSSWFTGKIILCVSPLCAACTTPQKGMLLLSVLCLLRLSARRSQDNKPPRDFLRPVSAQGCFRVYAIQNAAQRRG